MHTVRFTGDLVVHAVGLGGSGAYLVSLIPVKIPGTRITMGLIAVAQIVLVAVHVVRQVDEIFGIIVQRAHVTIALDTQLIHTLFMCLAVLQSGSTVTLNGLSGVTLDVLGA